MVWSTLWPQCHRSLSAGETWRSKYKRLEEIVKGNVRFTMREPKERGNIAIEGTETKG